MNPISIQQYSDSDAATATANLQAEIESAGIEASNIAKKGQVNSFYSIMIPLAYSAEFDASDAEKQQNFAFFSANALKPEYSGIAFNVAWETEYNKIY